MSRPPAANRVPTRDMYWFAHGGVESGNDKCLNQRNTPGEGEEDVNDSTSPTLRSAQERKNLFDEQKSPTSLNSVGDSGNSSGPSSLETKDEKNRNLEKRLAAEERRKQLWEAEQEKHDAVLRKHMEREAALEARKNAQRSHISFAFGSSVPRNVESLQTGESDRTGKHSNAGGLLHREENPDTLHLRRSVSPSFNYCEHRVEVDGTSPQPSSAQSNLFCERKTFSPPCWLVGSGALIGGGEDLMSKSMTAAVPTSRGRRKNDLMPTVPYDRTAASKSSLASSSTRKRSVSMTRLDQLAQPRKHYVEANKANSTSNGATNALKNTIKSPTRPLSSASEQSGGSGLLGSSATRRVRSSPRKPRPVSIAGTIPDSKSLAEKVSPVKKTSVATKKLTEVKKASPITSKPSSTKPSEKSKPIEKARSPHPTSTPKAAKQPAVKQSPQPKTSTPKTPASKKAVTNKKKADIMVSSQPPAEATANQASESVKSSGSPPASPTPENAVSEADRNNAKRIISEEEAKAALAEKRRLAREQAEREAELERQKQEELRLQEEERCRLEEEEQKRLEEEQLHLLEEHRKLEEEKLRKAIEENARREEEERLKREEEQRLKAEQEKKAQEEAEKQRIELEEKLRKEEEERAERKKRLEKIMSRTRGKSSGTSPSGSVSGSDHLDSSENQQENLSSGANSLDSNPGEVASEPASLEPGTEKSVHVSDTASLEANPTFEVGSDNESLNDVVMPRSETASQDNSLVIIPEKADSNVLPAESNDIVEQKTEVAEVQAADTFNTSLVNEEEIKASVVEETEVELKHPVHESEAVENITDDQDKDVSVEMEKVVQEEAFNVANMPEQLNEVNEDNDKSHSETKTLQESGESALVANESEVILSFDQDDKKTEVKSDNSAGMSDPLLPDVSPPPERVSHDEMEMEHQSHFSTSSDIKLPDPIYETSDDGSISSEKHLQDYGNYSMNDQHNQESLQMADEVFNEKENAHSEEAHIDALDKQNTSPLMAAYDSQFEVGGMQESFYAYETSDVSHAAASEQSGEDKVEAVGDSSSANIEDTAEYLSNEKTDVTYVDENKENINSEVSHQNNPFASVSNDSAFDAFADKENVESDFPGNLSLDTSMYKGNYLPDQLNFENNPIQSTETMDNSFPVQESSVFEQQNENPSGLSKSPTVPSESLDFNNVTIIKAEGSEDCIGIISSVENDQVSNDFVQQSMQNELLKSNFEYSSITDSEDSSLDSNLSQVMTVEVSNKNSLGLNSENEPTEVLNNVQSENPFHEATLNGSCNSKANGDHYYENEIFSNGHRTESSDQGLERNGDYVQLDGNHISSVDHSKTNIFENVSAVDFGKMASDPFLAKGNSTQISGNPFLLQDDQKQVLMTPDFFN